MCRDCGCSTASIFRTEKKLTMNHSTLNSLQTPAPTREIRVEESIFQRNQELANINRQKFVLTKTRVFNVMSSPGAGKTTLLARLLPSISQKNGTRIVVLVGDQETSIDADRLKAVGLDAVQINTHSSCHLDASRVAEHLSDSQLKSKDWVVIENVGNLVCPAVFDLGEQMKIAVLSVTEGEEKPLKYPVLFQDAHIVVITKIDLLPHLDLDLELLISNIRMQNATSPIVLCSARTGDGLEELQRALLQPTSEGNA